MNESCSFLYFIKNGDFLPLQGMKYVKVHVKESDYHI